MEKRIKEHGDVKLIRITDVSFPGDVCLTETKKNLIIICHLYKIYSYGSQL